MRTVSPVSPGEMLDEEFLKPLGLTKYRLATNDFVVSPNRLKIKPGIDLVSGDY